MLQHRASVQGKPIALATFLLLGFLHIQLFAPCSAENMQSVSQTANSSGGESAATSNSGNTEQASTGGDTVAKTPETFSLPEGQALFVKGKYDEALKHFDNGVDDNPTDSASHLWRARCLDALLRFKDAVAEYKLAMLLSSDEAVKKECADALKKNNESVPIGTVSPIENKKAFKLSTKKLEWNVGAEKEFKANLDAQDAQLAAALRGGPGVFGLATGRGFRPVNLEAELKAGPAHSTFQLATEDVRALQNADVYIILDHSGSMSSEDCPSADLKPMERLEWAIEEMLGFTRTLEKALPHGFIFIPFNNTPEAHSIRTAEQFNQLLRNMKPGGGTQLSPAIELAFRYHAYHLDKPILIAIVSDGEVSIDNVKKTIADATRRFPLPNGLFVTFCQIGITSSARTELTEEMKQQMGNDIQGLYSLNYLVNNSRAVYNPCLVVPFKQLRKYGLGRTILRGLRAYYPLKPTAAATTDGDKAKPNGVKQDTRKTNESKPGTSKPGIRNPGR
ncbi:tetratricopeptide repeat protein [Candidatus Obscuribacterales bacterium]|nr:tetratricopeptide repeat protein [Candidatus Obscuribacterales bacterium]